MGGGPVKILLAMPGTRENQERFWADAIVSQGLEDVTELCFQANGKWNDQYPHDLIATHTLEQIAEEQYDFTRVRIDDDYQPKPYTHCFLDYEPKKPDLEGPDSAWLWSKMVGGFDDTDTAVLNAMRSGVRKATGGLDYGVYRVPALPKRPVTAHDKFVVDSARDIVTPCEWSWLRCYPQGEINRMNIAEYWEQLDTQHAALSKYGAKVVPWLWPAYTQTEGEAINTAAIALDLLNRVAEIDTVGVWVDLNHESAARVQTDNAVAIAPHLRRFADAGRPQGND